MSPFLIGLIGTIIPVLVTEAEKLFPGTGTGQTKHDWVKGFVKTMIDGLDKIVPNWVKPSEEVIAVAIDAAIETGLNSLGI